MSGGPQGPPHAQPKAGLAVPAAGWGSRMGGARKPWLELAGEPLLAHALRPFLAHPQVVAVRVALSPEDAADPPLWLLHLDPRLAVVQGGATRTESVARALAALPEDLDVILVHDAARPLVSPAVVARCLELAAGGRAAVAGFPAVDTLKEVDASGRVVRTPDRARFWQAQTPQAFPAEVIRRAYRAAPPAGATDDASLVEALGAPVVMVESSAENLKVTRPEDLPLAEVLLARARQGGR